MKDSDSNSSNIRAIVWVLLVAIPIVGATIYLKLEAEDDPLAMDEDSLTCDETRIAVPDTTMGSDSFPTVPDTVMVFESVGIDTRSAMEAGDEDGYWDGWYDGAETGQRTRYDDNSNYSTLRDREVYAKSYREGYEKGFSESVLQAKQ